MVESYRKLEKINHIYDTLEYFDFSVKSIVQSHITLLHNIKYGNDFTSSVELNFAKEQNFLLNNLLSSFRTYLDTTPQILSKLSKTLQNNFVNKTHDIYLGFRSLKK